MNLTNTDHDVDHKRFQCIFKVKIAQLHYLNNKILLEINIRTLKEKKLKLIGHFRNSHINNK